MPRPRIDLPPEFHFRTELTIRINDVNYGGHMGNDAALSLLHEARVRMLKEEGWTELNIEGIGFMMTDATVLYKSEAFQGDDVVIEISVTDLSNAGCDFTYRMTQKRSGREIVRARTGVVFFDYALRKIAPVPSGFARRFGNQENGRA
jgi:acyl-CoA thioester hydrolase